MKRYGNLWTEVVNFENLLSAARQAQKGKRFRDNVLAFNYNLEQELEQIQTQLCDKSYCPGAYKTFEVKEESRPAPVILVTASENQTGLGSLVSRR